MLCGTKQIAFVQTETSIDDFYNFQYYKGENLLRAYRDTGTELRGMIDQGSSLDVEVVPLAFAGAVPSGVIQRAAFEEVVSTLEAAADRVGQVDGLCLQLHGAMVCQGYGDPEADLVDALHRRFGRVPTSVVVDLHEQ